MANIIIHKESLANHMTDLNRDYKTNTVSYLKNV